MTAAIARDPIYRGRRFQTEIIELCVRWYLTYRLSYRDLVEMVAERGVNVSHTTIYRWVQRFVPEFERRWNRYAKPVHPSWRMDETVISVRGGDCYLYRAVDKLGKTVDSLLSADRSVDAARAFFLGAQATHHPRWPQKINLDGIAASHRALRLLRHEDPKWQGVTVRSCRYLNNIVEQDHRAIKRRCATMLAFKSFPTAAVTLAGVELAHRIRKRQFSLDSRNAAGLSSFEHLWVRAMSRRDPGPPVRSRARPSMQQISLTPSRLRTEMTCANSDLCATPERSRSKGACISWLLREAVAAGTTGSFFDASGKGYLWAPTRRSVLNAPRHVIGSPAISWIEDGIRAK